MMRGIHVLPPELELLNTLLAKVRIKVEQCIGLLENRFSYYCGVSTIIKDEAPMKHIINKETVHLTQFAVGVILSKTIGRCAGRGGRV
jgi:hypothetical protein